MINLLLVTDRLFSISTVRSSDLYIKCNHCSLRSVPSLLPSDVNQ